MTRALRPRKSRPSYAEMAGLDLDEEVDPSQKAGPSKKSIYNDESGDSGSDFAPEPHAVLTQDEDEIMNDPDADEDEEEDFVLPKKPQIQLARATKAATTSPKSPTGKPRFSHVEVPKLASLIPMASIPSVPRGGKRQTYVLPAPSVHHRHRAVPLYSRAGRVERLVSKPALFKPYETTMTNNFTENPKITDRMNKSWGHNVGCGPIWELVEDRGWFKEAIGSGPDADREEYRRPRVYANVDVKRGWEILNKGYVIVQCLCCVLNYLSSDKRLRTSQPILL